MVNITTVLIDMPVTVKSFVRENPDDSATIVLNARLSAEDRLEHYKHELYHIKNDDMESERTVDQVEAEAHTRRR